MTIQWGRTTALLLFATLMLSQHGCGSESKADTDQTDGDSTVDVSVDVPAGDVPRDMPSDVSDTDQQADVSDISIDSPDDMPLDTDTGDATDTTDMSMDVDAMDAMDSMDTADVVSDVCPAPPLGLPTPTMNRNGRWVEVPAISGANIPDRGLTIYLPADYDTSGLNYPVLYMHDGQNLFDDAQSFSGEWEVDETMDSLVQSGKIDQAWIVVGMHNTGGQRADDYTPTVDPMYGGGNGAAHATFVAETLKPWVDANFRTRCGATHTALAGSSLGGLSSLYILERYPTVFGRVAAISPSLWWDGEALLDDWTLSPVLPTHRLWIDAGSEEGTARVQSGRSLAGENASRLADVVRSGGGVFGLDLAFYDHVGAGHNEQAWAARLPSILTWTLGDDDYSAVTPDSVSTFVYRTQIAPAEWTAIAATATYDIVQLTWPPRQVVTFSDVIVAALDANGHAVGTSEATTRVVADINGVSEHGFLEVSYDTTMVAMRFEMTAPAGTTVAHVSGAPASLGTWDGVGISLTLEDGRWVGEAVVPVGADLQYKYTQGSWATVERDSSGIDISNRFVPTNAPLLIRDTVAQWAQP